MYLDIFNETFCVFLGPQCFTWIQCFVPWYAIHFRPGLSAKMAALHQVVMQKTYLVARRVVPIALHFLYNNGPQLTAFWSCNKIAKVNEKLNLSRVRIMLPTAVLQWRISSQNQTPKPAVCKYFLCVIEINSSNHD
jgi:hypothetical protein